MDATVVPGITTSAAFRGKVLGASYLGLSAHQARALRAAADGEGNHEMWMLMLHQQWPRPMSELRSRYHPRNISRNSARGIAASSGGTSYEHAWNNESRLSSSSGCRSSHQGYLSSRSTTPQDPTLQAVMSSRAPLQMVESARDSMSYRKGLTPQPTGPPHHQVPLPPINPRDFSGDERRQLNTASRAREAIDVERCIVYDLDGAFEGRARQLTAHPKYNGRIISGGLLAMHSPIAKHSPRAAIREAMETVPF